MKLVIGHFYPELLNLYGDKGNVKVLEKRAKWRDIEVEIKEISTANHNLSDIDIVILGGGSERDQLTVLEKIKDLKDAIKEYVENDGVMLAVCGGFRMLGKSCYLCGEKKEGLSLIDIYTEDGKKRYAKNTVVKSQFGNIAGFASHFSKTFINGEKPLGKIICGVGNNTDDDGEGIIYKNLIGTNLHGPLLPKNPKLADCLIKNALKKKYGEEIILKELDDSVEMSANYFIVNKYTADK